MVEFGMQNGPGTQTHDNFDYAKTYPSTSTTGYQNKWWNLACKTVQVHKRMTILVMQKRTQAHKQ